MDLYQWKKTLQEKEQERLKLLEDALNGIQTKEQYMITPQILNLKKDELYRTTMQPPGILENLSYGQSGTQVKTQNAVKNYSALQNNIPNNSFTPYEENKMDEVLKQYDQFKNEVEGYKNKQKQIRDDPSYNNEFQTPPPQEMALLRDPKIREMYGPPPQAAEEDAVKPKNLDFKDLYDEYNRQKPREDAKQQYPQSSEDQGVPPINLNDLRPQTKKSDGEDSNRTGKKKGKKKKKDKNDRTDEVQPNQDSNQPPPPPPKKKSRGCMIF